MSTHDGLILLTIYVGTFGAGALYEYIRGKVIKSYKRRKATRKGNK